MLFENILCSSCVFTGNWTVQLPPCCSHLTSLSPFPTHSHLDVVQQHHTEPPHPSCWELHKHSSHFTLTLCREAVATGDLGLPRLAAVERSALVLEQRTRSPVDGSVHCKHRQWEIQAACPLLWIRWNLTAYTRSTFVSNPAGMFTRTPA